MRLSKRGWVTHTIGNALISYVNVVLKNHDAALTQFLKDMPFEDCSDLCYNPVFWFAIAFFLRAPSQCLSAYEEVS